ncbi:aspartyl protease [Ceratobasidium sp. AG-Ba]|nr:aspartyl protease [Ceratobasidium sp. AG-Ba]
MKSLVLLSLASAVSAASSSTHVPLVRRARSGIVTPESLAAQRQALDAKYGRGGGKVKSRQATSAGVSMTNQNADTSYYGIMNVGTPPVSYGVALDTGSSDLWFQSDECVSCTKGIRVQTTSTSLKQSGQPFSIRYGSGAVGGQIVSDVVQMGGFTIQDQVMGLVTNTSGILLTGQTAGLLGLAFQFLSNTQSVPFWEALVSSGQWAEPLMSFWMTRFTNVTTAQEEEYGGEFRMGATNATLYTGDIEYHDMPANLNSYWMIPLQQISVNGGEPILITNLGVTSLAAIETGTTLIGGPPDIVASIYQQIPGSQRGTGNLNGYWIYPCNQAVSLTFNFGGRAWSMAPEDFQLLTNDPSLCVGSVFEASLGGLGNPDVPQWIVGDAFLKNVYSVFRYNPPSIGFAQLSAFAANGGVGQVPPSTPVTSAASSASSLAPVESWNSPLIPTRTSSPAPTATGLPVGNGAAAHQWSAVAGSIALIMAAFSAI